MSMKFVNLRKSDLKGYRFNYKVPVFETASKLVLTENEIARKQKELLRAKINDDYDTKYGEGVRHENYNDRYKHQPSQENIRRQELEQEQLQNDVLNVIGEYNHERERAMNTRMRGNHLIERLRRGAEGDRIIAYDESVYYEPDYVYDLPPVDDDSLSGSIPMTHAEQAQSHESPASMRQFIVSSPQLVLVPLETGSATESYRDVPSTTEEQQLRSEIQQEKENGKEIEKAYEAVRLERIEEDRRSMMARYQKEGRVMRPKRGAGGFSNPEEEEGYNPHGASGSGT